MKKKSQLDEMIQNKLPYMVENIETAAEVNFRKYDVLGKAFWCSPSDCINRTTYQSEVDYMKLWLDTRIKWLCKQYNN